MFGEWEARSMKEYSGCENRQCASNQECVNAKCGTKCIFVRGGHGRTTCY